MKPTAYHQAIFETIAFLRHSIKAKGSHGIHSPLVYELISKTLKGGKKNKCFSEIETQRHKLLKNGETIRVDDFGAGSRSSISNSRKISSIAQRALQPAGSARALYHLIQHFRPTQMLELGTSLGITSAYMCKANPDARLFTIEGSPAIADIARGVFRELNITNAELIVGTFEEVLADTLLRMKSVDLVLIDGHHLYEPTWRYFNQIIQFVHPETIMILDDIHWSKEMESAWNEIRAHQMVTASLDFFHFGILFFKTGRTKEHFVLNLRS